MTPAEKRTRTPSATPETLRAIAHPVRLSLYEALLASGPATAARLSRVAPAAAPASLSYHLRQLAEAGFIEEAPELGHDARERWWRAVPGGINWSDEELEASPGTRKAAAEAEAVLLGRQLRRIRTWVRDARDRWPAQWRSAAMNSDGVLVIDAAELKQLGQDLDAVLDTWRERTRGRSAAEGSTGRESVFVSIHAFPFDPRDQAPADGPT